MAKRYYWLKLPDTWFDQKPIKKLRRIAGGDTYTIIYLKMLLKSIKNDGKIFFEGVEPTFAEELALDLDENEDDVQVTINFLLAQHLMTADSEGQPARQYEIPEAKLMTGSETASAQRVREFRQRKAIETGPELSIETSEALHCNTDVTACNNVKQNCNVEIEIRDRDREKIKDIKDVCPEPSVEGPGPAEETPLPKKPKRKKRTGSPAMAVSEADTYIKILLIGEKEFPVSRAYVEQMQKLYPGLDMDYEFKAMAAWSLNNPTRRKTASGVSRFINAWLARSQNEPRRESYPSNGTRTNNRTTFSNIPSHDYDFRDIERAQADRMRKLVEGEEGQKNG